MNPLRLRPLLINILDVLRFDLYSWYQDVRLIQADLPKSAAPGSLRLRPILGRPFESVKRVAKTVIDCLPYASGSNRPIML